MRLGTQTVSRLRSPLRHNSTVENQYLSKRAEEAAAYQLAEQPGHRSITTNPAHRGGFFFMCSRHNNPIGADMTTEITEFSPAYEVVTASLFTTLPTGESYSGPLIIGHYKADKDEPIELFIEREGQRVQFSAEDLPIIFKQLKRSFRSAQEMANG